MFHFLKPFQLLAPGVYSWKIFSLYERNFLTEDKTLYIVEKYRIVHFELIILGPAVRQKLGLCMLIFLCLNVWLFGLEFGTSVLSPPSVLAF